MVSYRWFVTSGFLALSAVCVTGCDLLNREPIDRKIGKSVVLIINGDKAGSGSGFFIQGPKQVCTVLTAGHVVASDDLKLRTYDDITYSAANAQRISNLDLAVVTFKPEQDKECPYKPLKLSNSDTVKTGDELYIAGFPAPLGSKPSELVYQFIPGKVTGVHPPKPESGYAIAYSADTIGGNSGGPVVNQAGQVIAVHGLTDKEVNRLTNLQAGNSSLENEESTGKQPGNSGLKWGVPINSYPKDLQISTEPALPNAKEWVTFGDGSYARGDYQGAVDAYEKALKIKEDYPEAWWKKGNAEIDLKEYEEAIKSFDKAIDLKPDYALAWNDRGVALGRQGKNENAVKSYEQATQISPNYSLAWYNRGMELYSLEEYQKAADSFEKAIKANNRWGSIRPVNAWQQKGDALYQLGNYQQAFEAYDELTKLDPDNVYSWTDRGNALMLLNEYQGGLKSYERAIKVKDYYYAWNGKCWALNELRQYQDALKACDKAIEIDYSPYYHNAYQQRGTALEGLGRYWDALKAYEKAIEIKPNLRAAIEGRNRMKKKLGQSN